mgnify:FL=1
MYLTKDKVFSVKSFTVPARSEVVVQGKLKRNNIPKGVIGLCTGHNTLSKLNLLAAKTLVCNDKYVPMRVVNATDHDVHVYRHTGIGVFNPLEPNDAVVSGHAKSAQNDCSRGDSMVNCEATSHVLSNVGEKPSTKLKELTPSCPEECSRDVFVSLLKENKDLSEVQKGELSDLLYSYRDVFAQSPKSLGHCKIVQHEIKVHPNTKPIRLRPHRANPHQRKIIEQKIQELLDQDIIEPSVSAWGAPVVLVQKKDGGYRFCVDYRKLNAVTIFDSFPLPRIDDCIDTLGITQPRFLSKVDLLQGYFQCDLEAGSRDKTTFVTHAGTFCFKRMSMGLVGAPATFSHLVEAVFKGLNYSSVLTYLDDCCCFSPSWKLHLKHLSEIFDRLRQANLKANLKKCAFGQSSIVYLGHRITSDGIMPDESKVKAVSSFPRPNNVSTLRSFLGLSGYYRKFIESYAQIARPLHELTRQDTVFEWSPECENAFQTLKNKLLEAPILGYPDFSKPFKLWTDCSGQALGACLTQAQGNSGPERVIAYYGRALNKHERNYSVTEQEGLAVVCAVKFFDTYLRHTKFQILTDHSALTYLFTAKNPPSSRLARWALFMSGYDYVIKHNPG